VKSPRDIAARMQRHWYRKTFRLEMLTNVDAWPKQYAIGLPSARDMTSTPNVVREHVALWQQVTLGDVTWQDVNFRASSEPIRVPSHWVLDRPSDWVRAVADTQVLADYKLLEELIGYAEPDLHDALITSLKLLQGRSLEELLAALEFAARLKPGDAQGRPLRMLAGHGVDTKFFERNRQLLIRLLDSRFGGEVSEQGLHSFLDATPDGEHWMLLAPLQSELLPFELLQVRSHELAKLTTDSIRVNHIIVVENRQCWHSLPKLDDTIAILGAGLDLDWLKGEWLQGKSIAYWGDIDTWGLAMLSRARLHQPQLTPLLMDSHTFKQHAAGNAVNESMGAGEEPPDALNDDEQSLYRWLLTLERGRLEQEYIPSELVHEVLKKWVADRKRSTNT